MEEHGDGRNEYRVVAELSRQFYYHGHGNKYRAEKVTVDGKTFDSRREAKRYAELALLQKAGAIRDLECQKRYRLIPTQRKDGKVVERPVDYVADFVYIDTATGALVVEDTKGFKTKDYIIKRKLMLQVYGVQIREV